MGRKVSYEEIEKERRKFKQYLSRVLLTIMARDKDFNRL
jgi:hypothetical protein